MLQTDSLYILNNVLALKQPKTEIDRAYLNMFILD